MVVLLLWISCSVFCYFIMRSKGYPNDKCWADCIGGFLMGVIWLIVVLCKKPYSGYNSNVSDNINQNRAGNTYQPSTTAPSPQRVAAQLEHQEPRQDVTQQVALQAIEKMADLKNKGILTVEEFEQKKAELLAKI